MSQKINEKARMIYDAYETTEAHLDAIAGKMADICSEAAAGQEPAGFIAKRVRETFDNDELEIIASMFIIRTINARTEDEEIEEACDCAGCRMGRGEHVDSEQIMADIKKMVADRYPGLEAMVVKVPKESKGGKTNC